MTCPFCRQEMQKGVLSGDGRSGVFWKAGEKKATLSERLTGTGAVSNVRYGLATFTLEAYYCSACRKMIFEADISR